MMPLRLAAACAFLLVLTDVASARTHLLIFSGQSNRKHLEPEKSVLPALAAACPEDRFLTVKDAVSGQPIRRWDKEWTPAEGSEEDPQKKDGRRPDACDGKSDGLHHTPDGYTKLGKRFAEKAVVFLKE